MRKTREEKAITLIALIITIVVLLILAVVAINAVTGDGIIQHATNAKTEYEKAQAKENGILAYYEQYLTTQSGLGPWKQEKNKIYMTNEEGKNIELQIGDKVEYNEETGKTTSVTSNFAMKDLEWRVLGINEKGQLELISTEATDSTVTLGGEDGYLNGPTKLDQICNELYSTEIASARSLNIEDINKVAGITEADKAYYGREYGYGTWWRYKFDTTLEQIVSSKSENYNPETKDGTWTEYIPATYNDSAVLVFKEPGKTQIDSSNTADVVEFRSTEYRYSLSDIIPSTNISYDGMLISNMIAGDTKLDEQGTVVPQFLASTSMQCSEAGIDFLIFAMGKLTVKRVWLKSSLHDVNSYGRDNAGRVRPVVTLNSNATLIKGNVDGEWKIEAVN